jgi:hypothetical protein
MSVGEGTTRNGGGAVFEGLDELASALGENDVSRGQAIKWAGYSVLGAAISSAGFAESAEALAHRQRRRCRGKGGILLEKRTYHCACKCTSDSSRFRCHGCTSGRCYRTLSGRGFCAQGALRGLVDHPQTSRLSRLLP